MARKNFYRQRKDSTRYNENIRAPRVMVIDEEGENLGELDTKEAIAMASEKGLDLVEVSSNDQATVCKIMDYGRYRFEQQKKKKDAKKKQKVIHVKEIQMRPNIDIHDFNFKIDHIKKFIGNGDKVKVSIRYRGRELAHKEKGYELVDKVIQQLQEETMVESPPKMEGRTLHTILTQKKTK